MSFLRLKGIGESDLHPKDPSVLKIVLRADSLRRDSYGNSKTLRIVLRSACFSRKKTIGKRYGYGGSKILRIRAPHYFFTGRYWEIKGRFRKRVVLANVPSFRFSFRGNIRRNHPFGNHPFVNTKKGHWEIKGRFPKGWFWRTYPRSGFRSAGTSAKTTLLETTLLRTPDF